MIVHDALTAALLLGTGFGGFVLAQSQRAVGWLALLALGALYFWRLEPAPLHSPPEVLAQHAASGRWVLAALVVALGAIAAGMRGQASATRAV